METKLVKKEMFGDKECYVYEINGELYMTREQIGEALGYKDPRKAISNIHARWKDIFDQYSTTLTVRTVDGKDRDIIVYSMDGVMEICSHSEQKIAREFMKFTWHVMKSVLTTGAYITEQRAQQEIEQNPIIAPILTEQLQVQRELSDNALRVRNKLMNHNCECFNHSYLTIDDMVEVLAAEGIYTTRSALFKKLRDCGYIKYYLWDGEWINVPISERTMDDYFILKDCKSNGYKYPRLFINSFGVKMIKNLYI